MTTPTGKHLRPKYYGYKGGFAKVTICEACGNTGLYEDQHPVNPCNNCGGRPIENFTAAFDGKKWAGLKVFKKSNMKLFYKGSVEYIIDKSLDAAPASLRESSQPHQEAQGVVSGITKFFPTFF